MRARQPQARQAAANKRKPKEAEGGALATRRGSVAAGNLKIAGRARNIRLDEGLHALIVGKSPAHPNAVADFGLPATQIAPFNDDRVTITIVSAAGERGGWLGAEGGTVVVAAGPGGGTILAMTYGVDDGEVLPSLQVVNIGQLAPNGDVAAPAEQGRTLSGELTLHIEGQGDRRFQVGGWAGNLGTRLRIEGFALRPLQAIAPGHIEYMAFGPGGRPTPWVTDARLCGTRGRGFPLTGFAFRLVPALRERFDIVYEGYFFDSGVTGPRRNGEPCLPSVVDDPLGAIRLRVIERLGA